MVGLGQYHGRVVASMDSTMGFMMRGPPSIDCGNDNKFPPTRGPSAALSLAVRGTDCRQEDRLTAMTSNSNDNSSR